MNKLLLSFTILIFTGHQLSAQRIELVPYPDAVCYTESGVGNLFLSNTDARTLMEYFAAEDVPDKIIPVRESYFSGYRLCYSMGKCDPLAESAEWIQILTIDKEAAIEYISRTTPDAISLPFSGLKECVGRIHSNEEYSDILERYKHLACRIYRQVTGPDGVVTDEMTALIKSCQLRIEGSDQAMYATSGKGGGIFRLDRQDNHGLDPWNEWISCFNAIEHQGYITLIEFNQPPLAPFME